MIISLDNISLSYGANLVLQDITARIEDQSRIGLIGTNGAGKSTLLNIIYGILEPDDGELARGSIKNLGFLRQDSGLENSNSIWSEMRSVFAHLREMEHEMHKISEQIATTPPESAEYKALSQQYTRLQESFEAQDGYNTDVKIATVLSGMGFWNVDRETSVDVLSGGERTRLALCKLLLQTPDLLILDEPTNHLDFKTLLWLEDYLADYKGALLIVSHDRYFLDRLCTSVWEVQNHRLSTYNGNYSAYVLQKEEREERQRREYEMQQQEIADMKDFIARNIVRASTSNRAKSRQKALDRMDITERPTPPPKPPSIRFKLSREPVKDVLFIENMALSVGEGEQEKLLFEGLNLAVTRGEKLAMIGANGVGKTSLLRSVLGEIPHNSGIIEWGRNTDVCYFDQGDDGFDSSKTAINALWDLYPREFEHAIRTALGRAGLVGENVFKQVGQLSGGERARLKFAKLMLSHGNVLILDEPTNHLDLATKEVIDKALCEYEGTLLIVSHDRYLLNKFPTKIVEMHPDGAVVFKGRYESYLQQKQLQQNLAAEKAAPKPVTKAENAPKGGYRGKKQRSEEAQRQQRLRELEGKIELLEAEIWQLEDEISQPEIASDYLLVQEKCELLEAKRLELDCTMNEWSELE